MEFCFAHDTCFVIPAEQLTDDGIANDFAAELLTRRRLSSAQLEHFNRGYSLYTRRLRDLFRRAPGSWSPPRRANLLIISDAMRVPPYHAPFWGTSAGLYQSDLDADIELIAFLLIHGDRQAFLRSARAAAIHDASYWLDRDDDAVDRFTSAAKSLKRPDADAYRTLASELGWIRTLHHSPLKPLTSDPTEPYVRVPGADLLLPKRLEAKLSSLGEAMETAAKKAVQRAHKAAPWSPKAADGLCAWLLETRPHLTIVDDKRRTVWSPDAKEATPFARALGQLSDDAAASLREDFTVIDARSRAFLAAVRSVDDLPKSCAVLEAGDGAWVDPALRSVVYSLAQPGFDVRARAAPPYHRLLLGARIAHEWGHLAHEGKLVRVPASRKGEYDTARSELGVAFAAIVERAPERTQAEITRELQALRIERAHLPKGLAKLALSRAGDYTANLVARRFLPEAEVQAYVRSNVTHHLNEGLGFIAQLSRHAHEVQYLAFAGLPIEWLFQTSRIGDYFLDSGLMKKDDLLALFAAAARVFGCYEIDAERLSA